MVTLLYVIDNMEFGGGERVFLQLASALRDHFKVFVAASPGGRFEEGLSGLGIRLIPVDMRQRPSFKPISELVRIIKEKKITLVHSQGGRADFFARVAGKMARVPYIVSTVAMPVEGYDVGRWRKAVYIFLDRLTERYVDRFIVVSEVLKETLIKGHKIPPYKVVRIYNGIEIGQYRHDATYADLRKEWGVPSHVPLIGAIGRLVWQKGLTHLLQAMPLVFQEYPDTRLILVGDGPLQEDLRDQVRDLGIEASVFFVGFRIDIPAVLAALDLLVVPSVLEGFPMTTLEAMAMAKPIVATDINGIREEIHNGKTGILMPPADPQALAEGIKQMLKDRTQAKNLGTEARKHVEEMFDIKQQVALHEEVYEELLKSRRTEV